MGAGGLVRGSITVDGHPKVHETFRRIASYVEQFDIHSPGATVHEALLFSAQLRLIGVSKPDTRKFVDEVCSLHLFIPWTDFLASCLPHNGCQCHANLDPLSLWCTAASHSASATQACAAL